MKNSRYSTGQADWERVDDIRFLQRVSGEDKPFPDCWRVHNPS